MFAKFGFHGVSTAKIAKKAQVSEALVFRHYKSKRGLLEAILAEVEAKVVVIFAPVVEELDPRKTIELFIAVPFVINEEEYDYWRLGFKVKWDQDFYDPHEMKFILKKVAWAFGQLGRKKPHLEAELLYQNIESIAVKILREGRESQVKFKRALIKKYLDQD